MNEDEKVQTEETAEAEKPAEEIKEETEKPEKDRKKAKKEAAREKAEEKKPLTLEEVRAVLANKSKDGFTEQIRELLKKYGSDRLSGINPTNYQALLEDVEGLKDAT